MECEIQQKRSVFLVTSVGRLFWWVSTLQQGRLSGDACRSVTIFIPHTCTYAYTDSLYFSMYALKGLCFWTTANTHWTGLRNVFQSCSVSLPKTHMDTFPLSLHVSVTQLLCGLHEVTHRAQVSFHDYTVSIQPIGILSWPLWGQWAASKHHICTSDMEGIGRGGCVCFRLCVCLCERGD